MKQDNEPEHAPEPPKVFDRSMIAVLVVVAAFFVYVAYTMLTAG